MLELLLLVGVAGTIWFLRYRQTRTATPAGTDGANSGPSKLSLLARIAPLLILVALVVFWGRVQDWVASWVVSSEFGSNLNGFIGLTEDQVKIWLTVLLAGGVLAWLIARHNDFVGNILWGGLAAIFIVIVVITALTNKTMFDLAAEGLVPESATPSVECGQLEERFGDTSDPRLGHDFAVVTICPGDGRQYVRVTNDGHSSLDIGFHQSALNEHGEALSTRHVAEFVTISRAAPSAYFLFVHPAPFADLDVDHLKFTVRALP